MRRWPSNWNGLVTTPTVRMPLSRTARATTGAAPVPVPPPMPAVMKAMCAPDRWSLISSSVSSAAARPISGCEPAPRPCVTATPIWMRRSALVIESAWASVLATTKSTPCSPASIMLLTALQPAPPTPKTVILGFSSVMSGIFRLILIVLVLPPFRRAAAGLFLTAPSEAFLDPPPHPREIAAGPRHQEPRRPRSAELLDLRHLRIDHEADRGREGRVLRRLRQAADAERPAEPDVASEHAPRRLREP